MCEGKQSVLQAVPGENSHFVWPENKQTSLLFFIRCKSGLNPLLDITIQRGKKKQPF